MAKEKIIIIDDEANIAELCKRILQEDGHDPVIAATGEEGLELIEKEKPRFVLLDIMLPKMDGMAVLKKINACDPTIQVIMITAFASVQSAVEAMKLGACDYLSKPFMPDELKIVMQKAIENVKLKEALSYRREKESKNFTIDNILGNCPQIKDVKETIIKITNLDKSASGEPPTILIRGETGTGKELVAKAIHFQSPRSLSPLIEVNCPAIPHNMMEAELFGHEKGSFTDAKTTRKGLFESADGGTIFLDEIGSLDPDMQVKMLKVIEDKKVRRIGSVIDRRVDVRIISATNRSLEEAVIQREFREDLLYRLKVVTIDLPALRERGDDILLIAQYFLEFYAKQYGKQTTSFNNKAKNLLTGYHWPGNIRELRHVIERAVIWEEKNQMGAANLFIKSPLTTNEFSLDLSKEQQIVIDLPHEGINLELVEKEIIQEILTQTNWNLSKAARLLGISRDTLRYRIEKYQISSLKHATCG